MKDSRLKIAYARMRRVYEKIRNLLAYGSLAVVIIVVYAGDILGPLRDILLPAAAVFALAIAFETVFSLSESVSSILRYEEYDSIVAALPKIVELISNDRKETQHICIIAITGGTSMNAIVPYLRNTRKSIDMEVLLMDPESPMMKYSPSHWSNEVIATMKRLKAECAQNGSIRVSRCALYENLPTVHGILINDRHLFFGYAGWEETASGPSMAGAQLRHRYYSRNHFSEPYFELFADWSRLAPSRGIDLNLDLAPQMGWISVSV